MPSGSFRATRTILVARLPRNEGDVAEEDARALGALIGDTPVRLDLIDVTDPTGRFRPPAADELRAFRDALIRYVGQPVVRRYSGGRDIQAALRHAGGDRAVIAAIGPVGAVVTPS